MRRATVVCMLLLVALAATSAASASAYVGTWTKTAQMSTLHVFGGAATLPDGRVVVVGGGNDWYPENGITQAVEAYTPSTDSWRTLAPLPLPRQRLAVVSLGGLIYAMGGTGVDGEYRSGVWSYNPAKNQWLLRASLPEPLASFAAVTSGGKIYAMGGSAMYRYDPKTNRWSSPTTLPQLRWDLTAATDTQGRIYIIGGDGADRYGVHSTYRYTPSSNSWKRVAQLVGGYVNSLAAARGSDSRIYVFSGGGKFTDGTVRVYNPSTNTWTVWTDDSWHGRVRPVRRRRH